MNDLTQALAPPQRVLIILHGAIGDVVRALPLLGRLRRAWPQAHLAWAVEPKSMALLEGHPWLDQLIIYNRRHPLTFPLFLYRVRAAGFDLVLDLQRHLKSGLVAWASRATKRLGFPPGNTKEFNHRFANAFVAPQPRMRLKLMQYQAFGDALGLPPAPIEFGLQPSAVEIAEAQRLLAHAPRPLLGVILGSSWPSRIYFPELTAAVISELHRRHRLTPVMLGSPGEQPLAEQVKRHLGDMPMLDLSGRTSLKVLAAVLSSCVAALGPDSGPMHIAAAMGCPVVSLWGSTAPERSAPWGYAHLALRGEIPCHPCYLRECPIGRECMRRIEPATVVEALERALNSAAPIAYDVASDG